MCCAPRCHFMPTSNQRHHGRCRWAATTAAAWGEGIKDLMARTGHDSERTALIYQH